MTGKLEGKRVLITAAGQGIGRASVLAFAREGAIVHATDINQQLLDALPKEAGIKPRKLDVLKTDEVNQVIGEIGAIDVLFNCAGFVHGGSILEMPDADLDFALDLNVRADDSHDPGRSAGHDRAQGWRDRQYVVGRQQR